MYKMFLSLSPTLMFCPCNILHGKMTEISGAALFQRLLQNCALLWGVINHKFNSPNVSKMLEIVLRKYNL